MKKRHITSIPVINHLMSGRLPLLTILLIVGLFVADLRAGRTSCPLDYFCALEGELECDTECFEIGDDDEDVTYISNLNPSIFSSCVRVFGKLYIDENTSLVDGQFVMEPGAEIIVMGSYRLTLTNSKLVAGCEQLWRGIRVADGGRIELFVTYVSGANAAIFLGNRCRIKVWESTFENNYIGIAAMPYDPTSVQKVVVAGVIGGCNFINSSVLRDPYSGHEYYPDWPTHADIPYNRDYAAVYLRRTSGLDVGVASAFSSTRNTINGLRNGVVLDTSISDVGYCDIMNLKGVLTRSHDLEDLTSTGVYAQVSVGYINHNEITSVQDGIVGFESTSNILNNYVLLKNLALPDRRAYTRGISLLNALSPNIVDMNEVEEGSIGILLYGGYTGEIEITNNTITTETEEKARTGIQVDVWKPIIGTGLIENNDITLTDVYAGNGIALNNVFNIDVLENTITFVRDNEEPNIASTGIRVYYGNSLNISKNDITGEGEYLSTDHSGIFYQNSALNYAFCNEIQSFARGFTGAGSSQMTTLRANSWGPSNTFGFHLAAPAALGPQNHNGNRWLDDFDPSFAALMTGDSDDFVKTAENSAFKIDNDNICDYWPCPISPGGIATIWFDDDPGMPLTCEPSSPVSPTDEDYEFHLLNPIEFENFEDQMTWMTKAWIYESILRDGGLLTNTSLDSFYNAEDTEPLGVLVGSDYAMREVSSTDLTDLAAVDADIFDSLDILLWIDFELYDLSPDSNALRSRREDLVDSLAVLQDDRLEILSGIAAGRGTSLSTIASALGSLVTDTDFEEFYRRALLYEIDAISNGLSSLSGGDWEEIQEIATLCGWEGGKASSIAMSICNVARDSIIDPFKPCTAVTPRSSEDLTSHATSKMMVFPNPTSTEWHVRIPSDAKTLRVVDLQGKEVLVVNIPPYTSEWTLSPSGQGIFILHAISKEGRTLSTEKIVMQR